jgi:hypothetical protein
LEIERFNLNINADLIWNHALDNNTGDPPTFGPAIYPTWQTPANTVYTFNGSSQTTASFNVNSTNVVGTKLDDSAFDVGGGAWTFSYYLKVTGSGTHYSLLNRDINYQYSYSAFFEHMVIYGGFYWRLGVGPDNDDPIWNYSFNTNQWYHIVLGYDGNGQGYGYVNKSLQSMNADNDPPVYYDSNTDFYIGSRPDGANKLVGQMKDMKWWNRLLSSSEVNNL